jgi:hypothetical protein
MKNHFHWLTILAVLLVLMVVPDTQARAADTEKEEPAPAGEPVGFVGTVIAVVPTSRTLVVDVPLAKDVLRVGAEVTDTTRITAAGQTVSLDRLQAGDRVRIRVRRIATGNEAIAVEVLPDPKG